MSSQCNLMVQDFELVCSADDRRIACEADAPTNPTRPLSATALAPTANR